MVKVKHECNVLGVVRKWAGELLGERIRVSHTRRGKSMIDCPFREKPVIKYLGSFITPTLVSCPTCGRTHLRDETGDVGPFIEWAKRVDEAIRKLRRPLKVAVMGCEVNGPGEARDADVGIALGKGRAALFRRGRVLRTVPLNQALPALLEEVERTW